MKTRETDSTEREGMNVDPWTLYSGRQSERSENNDDINYTVQVNKSQDNHQSLYAPNRFKAKANNETQIDQSKQNSWNEIHPRSTITASSSLDCLFLPPARRFHSC